MSLQTWFNRRWYGASPSWWLVPGSLLYGAAAGARRLLYLKGLRRSVRLSRPVLVVGNLSVGGTGKTPLVCWLVEQLIEAGLRPGVVSRGHGGSARLPRLISVDDDPAVVGDEPLLIARRTGAPVAVGRRRAAAAQLLIQAGCGAVVSDDGLQHYALERDCEVVVMDGERGLGNGWLLPAGPLRENAPRLATADAVVVNGGLPREGTLHMRLEGTVAVRLQGGERRALADFAGQTVHAVAGIGNPGRFFRMLRDRGIDLLEHALDDHASLSVETITFNDARPVLMTEKDAVKCARIAGSQHWYVPVEVHFEGGGAGALMDVVTVAMSAPGGRAGEV
jgi:tetraacyldisaccharide 4'-kinase